MLIHQRLDEVIAVVIARVLAQRQRLAYLLASAGKSLGQQLLLQQEFIGQTLVDQNAFGVRHLPMFLHLRRHQSAGIVRRPQAAILAQIRAKRLVSPSAIHRVGDGRKGRDAFEQPRVAQRQR